jgi:hypothetical protein
LKKISTNALFKKIIFLKKIRLGVAGPGRPNLELDPIKQRLACKPIYFIEI